MKKGGSFAGVNANAPIDVPKKTSPEDPAVFGGSQNHLPEGTLVELPEEGGYKVVQKPDKPSSI